MLSAVIPVYNERESLPVLHAELRDVASAAGYELECIFVDDGSTDGSWQTILALCQQDARTRGIRFRHNRGKAAALAAGFAVATGQIVATLDADLQDNPHELPHLLEALDSGADLVVGWKKVRHDPWHKVIPSRVFNALVGWVTGVRLHDVNCGLKLMRRDVIDAVPLYGELHRFVPILAASRGFRVGEVVVEHRPRRFGHSKYGMRRFLKGLFDLATVKFVTTYGERPQHLFGTAGLVAATIGIALLAWSRLAARDLWAGVDLRDLLGLALLLFGAQLFITGMVAELVVAGLRGRRRTRRAALDFVVETTFDEPELTGEDAAHQPDSSRRLRDSHVERMNVP
ncbi:MAG: glycosyltransferase family 2 protein [Pirellulales bacterium]|nr:glycosyltransferase family 2 protein [Pirellulales bacterium]